MVNYLLLLSLKFLSLALVGVASVVSTSGKVRQTMFLVADMVFLGGILLGIRGLLSAILLAVHDRCTHGVGQLGEYHARTHRLPSSVIRLAAC